MFRIAFICGLLLAVTTTSAAPSRAHSPRNCQVLITETPHRSTHYHGQRITVLDQKPLRSWNHKTVVLISGFSRGIPFWEDHSQELLAEGYRVLRFDLSNIGHTLARSGAVESPPLIDDAASVADVIEQQIDHDQEKFYIVGHSRGGAVALLTTHLLAQATKPKRVLLANTYIHCLRDYYEQVTSDQLTQASRTAHALLNPFYWNPITRPGLDRAIESGSQWWAKLWIGQDDGSAFIHYALKSRSPEEQTGLPHHLEVHALQQTMKGMLGSSILPVARQIEVPVRVLHGDSDTLLVPPGLRRELHQALDLSNNDVTNLPSGHYAPVDSYRDFMSWLLTNL